MFDHEDYEPFSLFDMEDNDDFLMHYGTPRHSGRYPWGSGKNPQRARDVISKAEAYAKKGLSEKEIAVALGYKNTSDYRAARTVAAEARSMDLYKTYKAAVKRAGGNTSAAARELGVNESSIRSMIKRYEDPSAKRSTKAQSSTMGILRDEMARLNKNGKIGYLDVGKSSNLYIGVTQSRLNSAVQSLVDNGEYDLINVRIDQMDNSGNSTPTKLLCPKGTTWAEATNHQGRIHLLSESGEHINKDTEERESLHDPVSIKKSRIYVRYAEEGGADKDGTLEIRPGVDDLSLGQNHYAQVRVLVGKDEYMKGMAHYSDDVPEGYDIIYNTNKTRDKADKVFKHLEEATEDTRPVDRFGALIRAQNDWEDENGKKHKGALNIVREEGKWEDWTDSLPSQFLGKQAPSVAKQQLALDYAKRKEEFEKIKNLTNPVLKHELLKPFADECDTAATEMKAAAFPRQGWHVILPNPRLKDNEIYAPGFNDGEKVILVRFPHEGTYQIPELVVNNRSISSRNMIGNTPSDAVVINSKVAERLSGADFDGDTVLVIPNNDGKLRSTEPIKELMEFDNKSAYPPIEGGPKAVVGTPKEGEYHWKEQLQMGMISNLITDMTIQGAPVDELVRATKHSMTVIDVKKHNLDWKRSERENNIQELRNKYQPHEDGKGGGGASTLLSRATNEVQIPQRKLAFNQKDPKTGEYIVKEGINVKTGEYVYQNTGRVSKTPDKEGNYTIEKPKMQFIQRMKLVSDARELMSGPNHEGTKIERVYADYANQCKALANEARKEYINMEMPSKDPESAKKYAAEVASLKAQLNEAKKNEPLDRIAKIQAAEKIKSMRQEGVTLSAADWKKEKSKALARARRDVGAHRYDIKISEKEWEAIQNNALSPSTLKEIFKKTDLQQIQQKAMPKNEKVLTDAKISRIKALARSGRTQQEIADALGISKSSVNKAINGL